MDENAISGALGNVGKSRRAAGGFAQASRAREGRRTNALAQVDRALPVFARPPRGPVGLAFKFKTIAS